MFLIHNPTHVSDLVNLQGHGDDRILSTATLRNLAGSLRQSRSVADVARWIQIPLGVTSGGGDRHGASDQPGTEIGKKEVGQKRQVLYLRLQEVILLLLSLRVLSEI